jgi:hypothetical protein
MKEAGGNAEILKQINKLLSTKESKVWWGAHAERVGG